MAVIDIQPYKKLVKAVRQLPLRSFWVDYDEEADVLYLNFTEATPATDSEFTEDDIIIRYDNETVIGFTILHASKRQ